MERDHDDLWQPFVDRHEEGLNDPINTPGTHALVIGVSSYPALRGRSVWRMSELDSAAASALEFAEWLNEDFRSASNRPLRSLRLLLSPVDSETERLAARIGGAPPATRANVKLALNAWADDLRRQGGGVAILYFAGHGTFATQWGSNLLLQDLSRERDLDASLDLAPILAGLGQIGPRESWVFVDACQAKLKKGVHFGSGGLSFPYEEGPTDRRDGWTVYAAAAEGTLAFGVVGGTSVFVRALLTALRKEAVGRLPNGAWGVDSKALADKLRDLVKHPDQRVWPRLEGRTLSLHSLHDPPKGTLRVTIAPATCADSFELSVVNEDDHPELPRSPFAPHPYELETEPGIYVVRLHSDGDLSWRPEQRAREVGPFGHVVADFEAFT